VRKLAPQSGPQQDFVSSSADIAIYGGAAGGGKSYALLLEGMRHVKNPGFRAIYFRRTSPELRSAGGLWDTSREIYGPCGGRARDALLEWQFPSGAWIKFSHLEHDTTRFAHQGAQYALIAFDEVNHFSSTAFWYLAGRNRSTSGVKPYIRATCNPDPSSWVASFIAWWIDEETGFAIPERSGVVRWFARDGDALVWGDSVEEVAAKAPYLFVDDSAEHVCLSATFISARLTDNPLLIEADPRYRAKLLAMSYVDRMRLLEGNWKIREKAGTLFREEWFHVADEAPVDATRVRYWDLSGSQRRRSDYTAGCRLAFAGGRYWIEDIRRIQARPLETERMIRQTAEWDGTGVDVWIEQEVGAAAEHVLDHYQRTVLPGFSVRGSDVRGAGTKVHRAKPASAAAEAGNVAILRGDWNRDFLVEAQNFPDGEHDDQVDAFVGAFLRVIDGQLAWATTS
jgi:predicted phage terminase large subunit-like protein